MQTQGELLASNLEKDKRMLEKLSNTIRVAIPAIIQSFNPDDGTVTAQIAIRERVIDRNGNLSFVDISTLVDVPVCIPKAGGFSLTLPIKKDDECLIVFSDMCFDAWFERGGVQNWVEMRRHDLSDGIAIIGISSKPNKITNYSEDTAQLRNENSSAYVEVTETEVNIVGILNINGHPYLNHEHTGVDTGSGISGGVASGT